LGTWNEVLRTNLTSAMLVSREIAKRMIQKRAGKIISAASDFVNGQIIYIDGGMMSVL
jgi:short-subunit dehydrogenase